MLPSKPEKAGKRGFVSAPLIGTVIFLSAIIFIVNLQNVEAQASLRVANDAYHNRVSSVLEQYRSDLSSIFREGLSRTLSYYILRQGWQTFVWSNDPNGGYFNPPSGITVPDGNPMLDGDLTGTADGKVSLQELKYGSCQSINRITSDVICSIPNADPNNNEYKYGLPQWMSEFLKDFTFEGVTFSTANKEQIKVFLPNERIPPKGTTPVEQALDEYNNYCRALLQGSVFDCRDFATQTDVAGNSKMHCVDHDANNNGRPDENPDDVKEIPGCEQGTFFVKVNVENPIQDAVIGTVQIYDKLPRVEAKDNGGNVFRSSGIGEKNFYLPINLRLFKYYDDTFKLYSTLAYGQAASDRNEGYREGVADGHCGGPTGADCAHTTTNKFEGDTGYGYQPYFNPNPYSPGDDDKVRDAVAQAFYNNVFKSACGLTVGMPQYDLKACKDSECTASETCENIASGVPGIMLEQLRVKLGPTFLNPQSDYCANPGSGGYTEICGFYGGLTGAGSGSHDPLPLSFQLVDKNDAYRIDPVQRVAFKWGVNIQHDSATP